MKAEHVGTTQRKDVVGVSGEKVALVTGGSRGIGAQIVRDLVMQGYLVFSVSRSAVDPEDPLRRQTDGRAWFVQADVSREEDLDALVEKIRRRTGTLDALVNNAGIMHAGGIGTLTPQQWEETMAVNLNAPYRLTRKVLPLMQDAGGVIVNMSSIGALAPGSSIAYSVSKAGLDMMTRYLADELAPYGIRVNGVNPGLVDTRFHVHNNVMTGPEYEAFMQEAAGGYPLGLGTEKDVSDLVMFLLSDKARWITGSIHVIDGGRLARR